MILILIFAEALALYGLIGALQAPCHRPGTLAQPSELYLHMHAALVTRRRIHSELPVIGSVTMQRSATLTKRCITCILSNAPSAS